MNSPHEPNPACAATALLRALETIPPEHSATKCRIWRFAAEAGGDWGWLVDVSYGLGTYPPGQNQRPEERIHLALSAYREADRDEGLEARRDALDLREEGER